MGKEQPPTTAEDDTHDGSGEEDELPGCEQGDVDVGRVSNEALVRTGSLPQEVDVAG
jgi:hypothetical protein